MSYVYMKVLESAPKRYDRGICILTLKQLKKIQQKIVETCVHPGAKILDIGCGTGSLAVMAAYKGATVVGIDISPEMLDVANKKIIADKVQEKVRLLRMGAVEMDRVFEKDSFDTIVSTLTFSEFSEDEVDYVLQQCHRVLKNNGYLGIADEILPRSVLRRVIFHLFRLPFVIVTYILTQTTTQAVATLHERITAAGFELREEYSYLLGTLRLYIAHKRERAEC